jgi:hypothetical protein
MATLCLFVCAGCGLHAEVSGGWDRTFWFESETCYCPKCKSLRDVTMRFTNDPTHPIPDEVRNEPIEFGKCAQCSNDQLIPWQADDPCPICGGSVSNRGVTLLLD